MPEQAVAGNDNSPSMGFWSFHRNLNFWVVII